MLGSTLVHFIDQFKATQGLPGGHSYLMYEPNITGEGVHFLALRLLIVPCVSWCASARPLP